MPKSRLRNGHNKRKNGKRILKEMFKKTVQNKYEKEFLAFSTQMSKFQDMADQQEADSGSEVVDVV